MTAPKAQESLLKKGVVIAVKEYQPPLDLKKQKFPTQYLQRPKLDIDIKFADLTEVKQMDVKQFKVFEQTFEKQFNAKFFETGKAVNTNMQTVVNRTIDAIDVALSDASKANTDEARAKAAKLINEVAANVQLTLQRHVQRWASEIEKLANEIYAKAVEASYVAMKKKVDRAKIKAVVKATIMVVCVVATGAALVATAIVAPPLAAAAIGLLAVKGVLVLKNAYAASKAVRTASDVMKQAVKALEDDVKKINEASQALQFARRTGSLIDTASAEFKTLKAGINDLNGNMGRLEKFVVMYRSERKTLDKVIADLQKEVNAKPGDAEVDKLKKKLGEAIAKRQKADAALDEMSRVRVAAQAVADKSAGPADVLVDDAVALTRQVVSVVGAANNVREFALAISSLV